MQAVLDFFTQDSESTLIEFLKTLIITLLALIIIVNVIKLIFKKAEKRARKSGRATGPLTVAKYILLIIVYLAAFVEIVNTIPSFSSFLKTLLAGSGVAAIILSVAAQEPIGNLVSGLLILLTRPFQVGDIIRYVDQDIVGYVDEITLRHTIIRTFENKRLIIPNNTFNTCAIENFNYAENKICLLLDFGITYESDAVLAMQIISDVVVMHPDFCDNRSEADITNGVPPVQVVVLRFDASSVVIRAWVWAANTSISVSMRSDILLGVQMRFDEAGIDFAYPHTAVIMEDGKKKKH